MRTLGRVIIALVITGVIAGSVTAGLIAWYRYTKAPLPLVDQCVARVQERDVGLDIEQTRNASIIVGVATQRDLAPRASTIALTTAYQESGIRNLDHGDRDSLGLFQQRPSQGWGTPEEIMNPYYSAGAFYDVLVTVPDWDTGDINDVAQTVQRSGFPDAYAKHVENARRMASALTGQTPASFSCVVRNPPAGDPAGLEQFLQRTLPEEVAVSRGSSSVTIEAPDNRTAWSAAHIALAQVGYYGVNGVTIGERSWTHSSTEVARWQGTETNATTVEVSFDAAPAPDTTPS
ncbi:MAG: hypothetical protein ACK5LS_04025 [Propioniciclava sp.]